MSETSVAKAGRILAIVAVAAGAALSGLACGSDTLTKGSFCSQTGGAACDRGVTCTLITSAEKAQCLTEFQASCCGDDSSCDEKPAGATEEMQAQQLLAACTPAFKTFDCAQLAQGNAPSECTTVTASTAALSSTAGALNIARAGARAGRAFTPR